MRSDRIGLAYIKDAITIAEEAITMAAYTLDVIGGLLKKHNIS